MSLQRDTDRFVDVVRTELKERGRVRGVVARNAAACLLARGDVDGPRLRVLADAIQLSSWRCLTHDRCADEYVLAWRALVWLDHKLGEWMQPVLWWTKDVPFRWRQWRDDWIGRDTEHSSPDRVGEYWFMPEVGSYVTTDVLERRGWHWPRIVTKTWVSDNGKYADYTHRRATLLEALRSWL